MSGALRNSPNALPAAPALVLTHCAHAPRPVLQATRLSLLHPGLFPPVQLAPGPAAAAVAGTLEGSNLLKFGLRPVASQARNRPLPLPSLRCPAALAP